MRTLAVCLLLALPASVAASERPHTTTIKKHTPRPQATCQTGCRIHRERVAVRRLRRKVVRRAQAAYLPHPRRAHLSWRRSQAHRELAYWRRKDRRTRTLASVPLSVRIPRWQEWQCIARHESFGIWSMSPTTEPPSGGAYWGGLQMDIEFQHTYGEDMIDASLWDVGSTRDDLQCVPPSATGMEDVRIDHRPDRPQRVTQFGIGTAVDGRSARTRTGEPEQHPNGGGLPRAVGADEAGDAPRAR